MPEGPELHLASQFVNLVSKGRIFRGPILKSAVSKHADVDFDGDYTISAMSRGKEMKLTLVSSCDDKKSASKSLALDIVFQFGMSGRFDFYEATELKKHAHLNFFTRDEPQMVLSYVDFRRFGKWQVGGKWSEDRGPCVLFEYQDFRKNVLDNVEKPAFNKPICECLLNQKYFNGIGNYLRAEILYRAGVPPFVSARSVLEPLIEKATKSDVKDNVKVKSEKVAMSGVSSEVTIKPESPDILQLCHTLPQEVINLGGTGYDPEGRDPDYSKFTEWLQCYYKPEMENMADHNKRTIWYHGKPGPMVPREIKKRMLKRSSKLSKSQSKKIKTEPQEFGGESEESVALTRGKLQETKKKLATKASKKSSARSLSVSKSNSFESSSSSTRSSLRSSAKSSKLSVQVSEKSSVESTENSSKRSAKKSSLKSSKKSKPLEAMPKVLAVKRRKSECSDKQVTHSRRNGKEEGEKKDSHVNVGGRKRREQVKSVSGRRRMSESTKNRNTQTR